MKILLAEDSTLYRMMIQNVVEDLGHECLIASDGQEAWEVFQEFGADVIISDWVMPRLEGPDLCRRLRAQGGARYIYFILLTALEEKQDFLAGMQAGADDYLTKPLDRETLEVRLLAAARVTSLHRQLSDRNAEMERLNGALFDSARIDPLTRVGNRLRLWEDLEALRGRIDRYGHHYCVALCDVDGFKGYNMRQAVEGLSIAHAGNPPLGVVTMSAGIAVLTTDEPPDSDALLARADAALYRAKRAGRNRVAASEEVLAAVG